MTAPTSDELRNLIQAGLPCDHIEIEGEDGRHYFATIVSPAFAGLSRIARHRLVYDVLGDRMRAQVHALSMRTLTPDEAGRAGA